jgi:hypothetical protein
MASSAAKIAMPTRSLATIWEVKSEPKRGRSGRRDEVYGRHAVALGRGHGAVEGDAPPVSEPVPPARECPPTTGRWLDHLSVPAYVSEDGPVCEDEAVRVHGPVGARMAEPPAERQASHCR